MESGNELRVMMRVVLGSRATVTGESKHESDDYVSIEVESGDKGGEEA